MRPLKDLKYRMHNLNLKRRSPTEDFETAGDQVKNVRREIDFIFLGSKITEDGDCRHEIKRCLLLGRKVMTNLDSILKSRDITLQLKVHLVKAMVFQYAV